jgi:hypothetical protein
MSQREEWEDIRPRFRAMVFQRGATEVAREIPSSRQSVYNWVNGETRPNVTARARIREIVDHGRTD